MTARVRDAAARLRSRACFRVVASCIGKGGERDGFRIVHFSVQSNHLHLIVEADDATALARGIQGLSIRIARAVNRVLERRGKVFADRYHAHQLRSPTETANAIAYVGGNITVWTTLCEQTRVDAFEIMIQHATEIGANAIIGARYDATEVSAGVTEVLAYGTA